MKLLKLTLKRQPNFYTRPGSWTGSQRIEHYRYTPDCTYSLVDGNGNHILDFCAKQFHQATGFKLKPGTEQRVEIEIKEVA